MPRQTPYAGIAKAFTAGEEIRILEGMLADLAVDSAAAKRALDAEMECQRLRDENEALQAKVNDLMEALHFCADLDERLEETGRDEQGMALCLAIMANAAADAITAAGGQIDPPQAGEGE